MNKSMLLAVVLLAATPALAAPMSAASYVAKAGAGDKFEIESSKLVLAETTNDKIKSFAQMMVDDHTKSTADVVAAAKADGMTPGPAKLMPNQTAMLAKLKTATGAKRDAMYEKQQLAAHQQALGVQKAYAASGTKPHLKAAATAIVPVVEQHITELKSMPSMSAS